MRLGASGRTATGAAAYEMAVEARRPPPVIRASLGGVMIGDGLEVCVMGAINVSPESFYGGSVAASRDRLVAAAAGMVAAGARLVDVGAMSTAPHGRGAITVSEEADRLGRAVHAVVSALGVPVSADTSRVEPARAALDAGAQVINDVTGLRGDPGLAPLIARAGAGLIAMASEPAGGPAGHPVLAVRDRLAGSVRAAVEAGIDTDHIAVDPGIGFFRGQGMPWHEWDCRVLAGLETLRDLGRPICVGVSRKSFIGAVAGPTDPADRLPGSLAAAAAAVLGGAHLLRAHDVAETVQAGRVALALRRAREGASPGDGGRGAPREG